MGRSRLGRTAKEGGGKMIRPGTVVHQIPDSDEAPALAREFCRTRKLTPEDAKIIRRNGMVMVEIKRPCLLKC